MIPLHSPRTPCQTLSELLAWAESAATKIVRLPCRKLQGTFGFDPTRCLLGYIPVGCVATTWPRKRNGRPKYQINREDLGARDAEGAAPDEAGGSAGRLFVRFRRRN